MAKTNFVMENGHEWPKIEEKIWSKPSLGFTKQAIKNN